MGNDQAKLGRKPKNIRSQNKELIINLYRQYSELSISDISRRVGLSRTTVMNINQELLENRIIVEAGKGVSTGEGGKKPNIYRFEAERMLILTFYVKHDTLLFALYDLKYSVKLQDSSPISTDSTFQDVATAMQELIARNILDNERYRQKELLVCMIGVHGNIDLQSGICRQSTHFPTWGVDSNLLQIIRDTVTITCPVYIDHWIRLKTYGENRMGSLGSHDSVVVIDAGWHGVVSGIMLNGNIYTGKHFLSGEVGHFSINPDDDEVCHCGSHGCFERQISLQRLCGRVAALLPEYPESRLRAVKGNCTLRELFTAADLGDTLAQRILDEAAHWFSLMISYIILFFDPETLFIEGDWASGCRYFEQAVSRKIQSISLPRLKRENVLQYAPNSSEAVLRGAAVMAYDRFHAVHGVKEGIVTHDIP